MEFKKPFSVAERTLFLRIEDVLQIFIEGGTAAVSAVHGSQYLHVINRVKVEFTRNAFQEKFLQKTVNYFRLFLRYPVKIAFSFFVRRLNQQTLTVIYFVSGINNLTSCPLTESVSALSQ